MPTEADLRTALQALTPEQQAALLRTLKAPESVRAEAIRRVYEGGGPIVELLMDLEADEVARSMVIEALETG